MIASKSKEVAMSAANDFVAARCIRVGQPIGDFFCCVMSAKDVLAIAYADVRRIEDRDIERIVGIQRELKPARVREIKQYVKNVDATFPTSVILAVGPEDARFVASANELRIRRQQDVAKIIDGQHRIAGLEGFAGEFELVVVIFVDMDLQDQAMTFATINLAQTKVNRSLVYDLYEFERERSPIKTCHQIARLLNKEEDSPLHSRIKILGSATGEEFEFITQATVVSSLVVYISDNPMRDRDALKRGNTLPEPPTSKRPKLIFRELFEHKNDDLIADVVWTFFDGVARRWNEAWHSSDRGDILNRTQGFKALMRFLLPLYRKASQKDGSIKLRDVDEILKKIRIPDGQFTTDRYRPGTSGEAQLYRDLMEQSGIENDQA
jgi:DGQHR domain-containing protein